MNIYNIYKLLKFYIKILIIYKNVSWSVFVRVY
jgi:hypothetical protein